MSDASAAEFQAPTSAAELFRALESPDAIGRRRLLAWLASHPSDALALGTHDGRDVVDVLLKLTETSLDFRFWEDVAMTIAVFDAPKVTEFLISLLERADAPATAEFAAEALSHRDCSAIRERIAAQVADGAHPDRVIAAAGLLVDAPGLPPAVAVRVAALEEEREPPPWDAETEEAWLAELSGPFADLARVLLASGVPGSGERLVANWEELSEENRTWLLEELDGADPAIAEGVVLRALRDDRATVQLAALEAAHRMEMEVPASAVAAMRKSPDADIRAAAVAAAGEAPGPGLREPELERALASAGRRGVPAGEIVQHLESDSPGVRAAAHRALVEIGKPAIGEIRPLVGSERPEVRAAAVRTLLDLGDDDWLARELLGEPAPERR